MARRTSIGRIMFSGDYHRSRRGYPLWAHCQRRMLYERVDPAAATNLEERGLTACPRCFVPVWMEEAAQAKRGQV